MMELAPYLFLLLAAGLAGISMRFMLELKKKSLMFERQQQTVRRRLEEHQRILEGFGDKIATMEGDLEKSQADLASLQMQHKEAATHLTELEAKEERRHPSGRRIDMDAEEE